MQRIELLKATLGVQETAVQMVLQAERDEADAFAAIDERALFNQAKVLEAFRQEGVGEAHLQGTTGYGYDDLGREALDRVFARAFGAQDALVRHNIISGTHAIALCLFGVLRPGDTLVALTGRPYDTLEEAIGIRGEGSGSLKDFGVHYCEVPLTSVGEVDFEAARRALSERPKAVLIQRSMGYSWRRSFSVEKIGEMVRFVKEISPDTICIVDNCYGEFVETIEPTSVGADLMAGSLIKNPGGGLAPCGGYVAGKRKYVDLAASRLASPGIGRECGATLEVSRAFFQGFFLSPHVVAQALKTACLTSAVLQYLGFEVLPKPTDPRSCIIQAVRFGKPELLIPFCQGVQKGSPVDSFVCPEPWDMPGYESQVIMAAGTFTQGASIELSCDAPIREPYIAYLQGGLTYESGLCGLICAVDAILKIL